MLADVISYHVFQLFTDRLFIKRFEEIKHLSCLTISTAIACFLSTSELDLSLTQVSNSMRTTGPFRLCRPDQSQSQLFTIIKRRRHYFNNGDNLQPSNEYFIPSAPSNPAFMVVGRSTFILLVCKDSRL